LLVQRSTVAAKIFFESARLALALRYLNANEACRPVQAPQASPEHEAPLALVNMWRINQDDAVAAACTSRYQLWVCVRGRSPAGYHFYFFVLIPTSTGDWKLAQEGSNFARQRNSTIFFVAMRRFAFSLPVVGLRERRPAGLPPPPTLRQFRQSVAPARHTSA